MADTAPLSEKTTSTNYRPKTQAILSLFFGFFASPWVANRLALRILPLGDSITYGSGSTSGNGYRLELQNLLVGNTVQYVGSQHSGSMANNSNEGHPGAVITQIAQFAQLGLNQLPNIVLLMAGTNDMNVPTASKTAPDQLGSLIDEIISAAPNAVVLIAQLIPSTNEITAKNIGIFNEAVPGIVATRANSKKKVMVVNMTKYVTTNGLNDTLHPNDDGYTKMAQAWYDGIQQASSNSWIVPPPPLNITTISGRTLCSGVVQWVDRGTVATGAGDATLELFFADINGDGKADYLTMDNAGKTKAWFNQGGPGSNIWNEEGVIAQGVGKTRATIRFADINGDGFDDYLAVDPTTGAVEMWQNGGSFDSSKNWKWTSIGNIASGVGVGAGVYFADIDGDGKDDYVFLDGNGRASLWLNGGRGANGNWIWNSKGVIASGVGATREEIRLADIDGDGKADYFYVDKLTGETKMWRNGGLGDDGNWIWTAVGEIATGVGTIGSVVRFADFGGTGRADYLIIVPVSLGVKKWENTCGTGSGGVTTLTSVSVSVIVSTPEASATVDGGSMGSIPDVTRTVNNMNSAPTPTTIDPSGQGSALIIPTASPPAKSGTQVTRSLNIEDILLLALVLMVVMIVL